MLEAIKYILKEHINNRKMILKLAIISMGKQTIRTTFGFLWVYIHDILYFSAYILFRILVAGNEKVEGMNNVVYLITGLIPWFFMSEVLNLGSHAIKSNKGIINSIKFPISVISTIEVLSIFFKRILTFALILIVIIFYRYMGQFNILLFLYYLICMLILMWAINFLVSPFVAISADFTQVYLAINRVLMYLLPIIWSFEKISKYYYLSIILKINPMGYVISGFRDAFVLNNLPDMIYTLYFWICVCILICIGSFVQHSLRKYYSDFI
jgi:teichoic acid transport system permease protein